MQGALWILAFLSAAYSARSPLITEYEWKYFDYVWKSSEHKNSYIRDGLYDYKNMAPIDVDRSIDGRTFVTVIRAAGVPASVHTISNVRGESGALLQPYPDWSWYENNKNCQGIVSAYRVAIDECNRIWVLDTGIFGEERICPAQLLVFNLYTDKLLFKIKIPDHVSRSKNGNGEGMLITPIVETYGRTCDNTTVYMADVTGNALVVWTSFRLFRLEADVFEPEERNANFTIAGESFHLADGVLGMALSPVQPDDSRYLSFRPLASRSLYAADTRVLQRSIDGRKIKYYRGVDVLPSQGSAQAFSSGGTLFYGLASEIAIGCWNMHKPLLPAYFKIAIQDKLRLQFTSGMKVIKNPGFFPKQEEQLLLMTNRLQKIYAGTQNFNEINFRVLRAAVGDLVRGTACAM